MYYFALAADYDGTLAHDSAVAPSTVEALNALKASGRRLILVTGRELPHLQAAFPDWAIFDRIVAENGALLFAPESREERPLAQAPPTEFVKSLIDRGVAPLSVGRSIVATWEPHQATVLEAIHQFGLELEIVFNKGAVMVLPSGVNKASGLAAALDDLGLSSHNVVGVGDAENDHAFLRACGLSVAVANALGAVKEIADLVTDGDHGLGVEQLVRLMIDKDEELDVRRRSHFSLTPDPDMAWSLGPRDIALIAGSSGFGKSSLVTAVTERLREREFQFCLLDPEGDHEGLEGAVTVGGGEVAPKIDQVLEVLAEPRDNAVVNTLAVKVEDRPDVFAELYPKLATMRARTGRPHWLLVDEAHHLAPRHRDGASLALGRKASGMMLVTVQPDEISPDILADVTVVLGIGPDAGDAIERWCRITGRPAPDLGPMPERHQLLYWRPDGEAGPTIIDSIAPRQEHKRHSRKYAEGHLDEERSFYFRGPKRALNLRADNLQVFLQMAEGVDDDTWDFHLRRGDYSKWFEGRIQDEELAREAASIEEDQSLPPGESRKRIAEVVTRRYTAPAAS